MAAPHRASATQLLPPLAPLLALLFFAAATAAAPAAAGGGGHAAGNGAMTHLRFYFHEIYTSGPNGTTAQVSPPARVNSSTGCGSLGVVDDMLREGADSASRLIGRAQGLTVTSSLSDGAITTMLDFVFTEGPYSGSTLAVFGRALLGTAMERPVVCGTGAFRMARGYTLIRMVNSTDPSSLLILQYDAYVWH